MEQRLLISKAYFLIKRTFVKELFCKLSFCVFDDEKIFDGNLSTVTIVEGEEETTYNNMSLIHCTKYDSEYWFALRELTETELVAIKNRSDIDYIALMCDVEL